MQSLIAVAILENNFQSPPVTRLGLGTVTRWPKSGKFNSSNGVCILRPRKNGIIGFWPLGQKFIKTQDCLYRDLVARFQKSAISKNRFCDVNYPKNHYSDPKLKLQF